MVVRNAYVFGWMPYYAPAIMTPMPIFVVVGHTEIPKLGDAIRAAYPGGSISSYRPVHGL